MARDLNGAELALASETTFPLIDGTDTSLLSFPAFGANEGLRIVPQGRSTDAALNWALAMDVYTPQPVTTFTALVQTDDGDAELFLRDNGDGTAGIGISGVYDGAVPFDAWTRIVVTFTQEGANTILRKFIDGALVGTQDLGATTRFGIDPATGLTLFNDNDGENAAGAVSSVFLTTEVGTPDEVASLVASIPTPTAFGILPAAPSPAAIEIRFDNEDLQPAYGSAEVFLDGFGFQTPVVLNESRLGFASQLGIVGPDGDDINVLEYDAYNPAEAILMGLPVSDHDHSSYSLIWDIRVDELSGFQSLLQTDVTQSGDGDFFIRSDGGLGINSDYDGTITTDTWHRIAITVEDQDDGSSILTKYLDGTLLDSQTVSAERFTLNTATGFLLLSDNDGETGTGYLSHFGMYETVLTASEIAALGGADGAGPMPMVDPVPAMPLPETGTGTRDLTLSFASTFRPYDNMTGEVLVSVDGGEFASLLTLDTSTVAGGASSLDRVNVTETLTFQVAENASDVQFQFNLRDGGNDWWWAIDNIVLTDDASGEIVFGEGFDSLAATLQEAVDENIGTLGWTPDAPTGWTVENDANMPQGATEWQGWTFATPDFWTSADGQNRGDFTLGSGVIAIADTDEWDDFNDGTATGDDFNSTLSTPTITLEVPQNDRANLVGFDGYQATVESGFGSVQIVDNPVDTGGQDNIKDLLLVDDGTPVTYDLLEVFGAGANTFEVTSADGSIVDATLDGTTLSLSGSALGHSDISVTALDGDGQPLVETFRAIVAGENAYVFAIIPDTQDYTSNSTISDTFGNMTTWLVDQKDSLDIIHAIHVGDIVQFGSESQWQIAEEAMERLDGELSYTLAIGNHDQQRPGFSSAFSFETDVDTYFTPEQVGATAAQGGGTYDGFDVGEDTFGNGNTYADSIRNHYTTLTAPDGTDWLIFSLEFGMPDDVLRWAEEVIEQHLDHRVIIDTHAWQGGDGRLTPVTEPLTTDNDGWGYAIRENPRGVNGGEDAWREFASKYPNITFTFNGHNFMGGAETTVSYAAGDNPVFQTFVNYQGGAWAGPEGIGTNGGNGAMRLMVIDPDNDRITTHTKLTELDTYFEEFPDHQEVFEGVDLGTPEQIAIAKAGATMVVVGDGITGTVSLDPSATLGDTTGATFEWFAADGEKLGETDGTALEVDLQTGTNRLTLVVTDQNSNVSTDDQTVMVEAPEALLTETFDDGDLAGWGSPGSDAADIFALGTDVGFSLPSIGGIEQIPVEVSFDSSFRPYDDMTGEVLVSFDDGATFASLLTLDTTTVEGGSSSLSRVNVRESVEALVPNSATNVQFAFRMSEGGNDWWWAIDNIDVTSDAVTREAIFAEDFEGLTLQPFSSATESGGDGTDWTTTAPTGWTRDLGMTPTSGVPEFEPWAFMDINSWIATAGDQGRSTFTLGTGTVAVADGDEYEDAGDVTANSINVFMETPEIDITGYDEGSLQLSFDSSFRPYADMTGTVEVSFDGGTTFSTLLTLDPTTAGGNSSLSRANEAVTLDLDPGAEDTAIVRFNYLTADNDWWWALDNIEISGETTTTTSLLSENFDALASELQSAVDENIDPATLGWTHTAPDGWTREVDETTPQGTTEWQGWSFATPEFWTTADGQNRGDFTLGTGVIAIADPDEWDDFNTGSEDGSDFGTTLTTPLVDITSIGGGQETGAEAGVVRVPALSGDDGLLLTPTGSTGQIDNYTIIFDLLLTETTQTFTSLFQTDVTNSGDADIYLRNDGSTYSIGISSDYDGAVAYGDWARIALTLETDVNGEQTLTKYLDGVLLDTQVVDADVSDGSRWSINADEGFLLFSEPNGFTSEAYVNSVYFTPEVEDEVIIASLGGVDVDGPVDVAVGEAFQLNFDTGLDSLDFGSATLEAVSLAGPNDTSYLVKGSIFGNPNGEGEAALYQQSNGSDERLVWLGEGATEWTDYTFDMVIEPADNDTVGALFYYADDQNYYQLTMDQQTDTRTLTKVEGGVETVLATETASYRHFAKQDLRIAVLGGEITITLDDEVMFDGPVTDAAPLAGGSVGILSQSMNRVEFDNISVNPITLAARVLTQEADGHKVADLDGDGFGTVNLTAAASLSAAGIVAYEWDLDGDGVFVDTGETVSLNLAPGDHTITLRVTDADGLTSEDRMTVSVVSNGSLLINDDFEDGDFNGWTIVDEGTIGGPSDWSVVGGELVQASDIASDQQGTGSAAYSVAGDGPFILRDGTHALWDAPEATGWTDYAMKLTLTPNDDDGIGVLFRYTDADNYYKLEADAQTGLTMLTRHFEGRETILARGYGEYTPGEAQTWRIEVEGGEIRTAIDGKDVFGTPVVDNTLTSGTVGLYSWASENLSFDNVVVTDLNFVADPDPLEGATISEGTSGRDRFTGTDGVVDAFVFEAEDTSFFSRDQIRDFEAGDLIDLRDFGFTEIGEGRSFPLEDGNLRVIDYGSFTGIFGTTDAGDVGLRIYGDVQSVLDGLIV